MQAQQLILKDIHLPVAMGWWPPAIGWWIVAGGVPLSCLLIIWLYKRITKKTAVKSAKKLLAVIKQDTTAEDEDKLKQLSQLIRRVAISISPRAEVASLTGQAWLEYLDSSVKGKPFTLGVGAVFADAQYRQSPHPDLDITQLITLCENWLSAQKQPKK